jgi:hypothetical protein
MNPVSATYAAKSPLSPYFTVLASFRIAAQRKSLNTNLLCLPASKMLAANWLHQNHRPSDPREGTWLRWNADARRFDASRSAGGS